MKPKSLIIVVKPVKIVFIDKGPLFGGYIVLSNQGRVTEMWPLFTGWSFFRSGH